MSMTMVLNTQMKYLFSYKMFMYTCTAEKTTLSSQSRRRSFAGGSPLWVKALRFEADKYLTSCLLILPLPWLWGRAWKRQARNPQVRLPPILPVLLASGCANSHREQLLPPPATAATACQPGTPELTCVALKEKSQKPPNTVGGGRGAGKRVESAALVGSLFSAPVFIWA